VTNHHSPNRPAVTGLTDEQLDKIIDLFCDQLSDDEMLLSFSDLHDLFDPNQLVHDLIEDETGELPWGEMVRISHGVTIILDAEATARRWFTNNNTTTEGN